MLFGKKKPNGETVLILDVESASAGAALLRQGYAGHAPGLFAETRHFLPLQPTRGARGLAQKIERAAHAALHGVSIVAARLRIHGAAARLGVISRAEVFLHAPWVSVKINQNSSAAEAPLTLTTGLRAAIGQHFGNIPIAFHAAAVAAAHAASAAFPYESDFLLGIIAGEIAELVRVEHDVLAARATIPFAERALLRTLQSHAGLSEAEARSALLLPAIPAHAEALLSASAHFAREFDEAAQNIGLPGRGPATSLFILGRGGMGEWFARSIGGRALTTKHLSALVAAHAEEPDPFFLPEALFVMNQ